MNPSEFIEFSGKIVAYGPAGARSAVSRAYYGAFHTALSFLNEMGCGAPRSGASHAIVPQLPNFARNADARLASRLLSDLHADRVKVDYRLENVSVESRAFAQLKVETANRIRELVDAFHNACGDSEVAAAFRTHVADVKRLRRIP